MEAFNPSTRTWFEENFDAPTPVQEQGWPRIAAGDHTLLIAPTGSGKTLAAFLSALDRLGHSPAPETEQVSVLYISPLKALVHDVERNLRAPLAGIYRTGARLGAAPRPLTAEFRTGDTPTRERERQRRHPPDILITTPESLFLLLGSRFRSNLTNVSTVIIDEVHALAGIKRGTHLALSLERLSALCEREPQRIGLSATISPISEVASFLGGDRSVKVVDCSAKPVLDLAVVVPVPDMENVPPPLPDGPALAAAGRAGHDLPDGDEPVFPDETSGPVLSQTYAREVATPPAERGIWSAIYPQLLEQVLANRSTIIFVNSRGLCERLAQRLNDLGGEELARAHHGSVSHEARNEIEQALKEGRLRAIVATSSLELGIDMGAVDLVLQVESPGAVARGLQRVGRAGHQVGALSRGRILPKFRGDLLESTVIAARMLEGELESLRVPRNVLDVLSQQIVAMVCDQERSPDEIFELVRRACPYREFGEASLTAVLEMLSGHYPSDEFASLRPRLVWDRAADVLKARRGAAMSTRLNAGTIPDRGLYPVHLGESGPRIGELDEEMVFETRVGDRVLLGASTWQVEAISHSRVTVSPAPGEPGRLPFWRGDGPGRDLDLGRAIGAFTRRIASWSAATAPDRLQAAAPLDRYAAENLCAYIQEQKQHTGAVPSDRAITVESFRDELGDWRVCILSPFGARVHAPWALAIQQGLSADAGFETQVMYTDDGIVLRFADCDEPPGPDVLFPEPDEVRDLVVAQLADSAMFSGLFRENAARSLLITRRRPGERSPLWAQRQKAQTLLAAVRKYPSFPVVLETYRQALSDVFDLEALRELLTDIQNQRIRVDEVQTPSASPFARSLVYAYIAAYVYEPDQPLAERRAQALTLDKSLLAELLGQAELRELLDTQVIDDVEADLQSVSPQRRARNPDEVHDLLRRIGDLSEHELDGRAVAFERGWLEQLEAEQRVLGVRINDELRFIAAEDAGLYRDALGVMHPTTLPARYLEPVAQALEKVLLRFARNRAPFLTADAAGRFGLLPAHADSGLHALERDGELLRGEFRPGGAQAEWCHPEVLRQIKRRTLAKLRNQIAAVPATVLARFMPRWQGLGEGRRGLAGLEETLDQLEGLALSWRVLSQDLLPSRVGDFEPEMLDMLAASGRIIWVGTGASGNRDGRVAIYSRERFPLLYPAQRGRLESDFEPDPPHERILGHLRDRGASFMTDIERVLRADEPGLTSKDITALVWDLVWAGLISNDTLAPLRSLAGGSATAGRARSRRRGFAGSGRGRLSAPMAGGRWFLIDDLLADMGTDRGATTDRAMQTQSALAVANMFLQRYGVVSRECSLSESHPGGFTTLYQTLNTMEDSGRVRRGYFVEGLSGAQFANGAVVDRLRAFETEDAPVPGEQPEVLVLDAPDPANVYGNLLPWPATTDPQARLRRLPGAKVIQCNGRAVLYVSANRKQLQTFELAADEEPLYEAAFAALADLPRRGRPRLSIERIDGVAARDSRFSGYLEANDFVRDYSGYMLNRVP